MSRSWQSTLLIAVFLITGGIFFAMALTEGILRLFPGLLSAELQQVIHAHPDDMGVAHPYIGHLHKPNNTFVLAGKDYRAVNRTDGYGFRNGWPWPEKAEIVAVGDSLTFGYGVEDNETWPELVAKKLPHNRLINLGLIGAGPQQYFRVYETFGTRLRPKVLLVGFFAGNDFVNVGWFNRWLESRSETNYLVWRDFGKPRSTSLSLQQPIGDLISSLWWRCRLFSSNSRLFNLLLYAREHIKTLISSERTTFQAPDGTRLDLAPEDLAKAISGAQPGYRSFDLTVDALRRLDAIARSKGTNVIIVLQPSKEEAYLPLLGQPPGDLTGPLRARLGELDIPYLDLLQEFRSQAANGEILFFERDGHPNRRGYALIAELVLAHLKNNAEKYGLKGLVQTSSPQEESTL